MKFKKAIGCLVAFTALVASGISFSGVKPVSADDIPVEEHYVVPAATVTPAYSYSDGPSSEPKYSGSTGYRSTATGSDGIYYYFSENDTTYGRMNVASTWNSYRGEGVKVAVIDTGCYSSHEDFSKTNFSSLSKNIYNGGTSPSDYNDTNGHGTSSVSTIAASINSVGGLGIAPNVELVVLKIDHPTYGMQVSYMNTALQWCIDNHVDVINMSVQGYASSFSYSYTEDFGQVSMSGTSEGIMGSTDVSAKLNACYNAGITVVAAAGNYNSSNKSYPAANDHVIAVASTGLTEANKNKKAGYSNYGEWVDICAPGYIMTPKTSSTSSYSITYGTSFSSPLVAGAIALYKCKYPTATPDQIERALKFTADKLSWSGSGAGAINVGKFLNQAPDYVYVESLSLGESTKTLTVGDTYTLHPTISPSNAANKNIIYESSDPAICDVDSNGVLTAKSVGQEVYIYATSEENSDVYDAFEVNVEASEDIPSSKVYKTITFTSSSMSTGTQAYNNVSFTNNCDGITTTVQNGNNNNKGWEYVKFGSKSEATTGSLTNTSAIDKKISKIDLTFGAVNNVTSATLYVSSNSSFTGATEISFTPVTGVTSVSIPNPIENGYYKIVFEMSKSSGNGPLSLSKIEYYSSGASPTPSTNYTVTFDSNGGSGTMSNATTTGSSYTTPSCGYTYSGYTFSKWALNSTSGTQYNANTQITGITGDITLYAIWIPNSIPSEIDDNFGNYYQTITSDLTGDDLLQALNSLNSSKRIRTMGYDALKSYGKYTEQDWTGLENVSGKMFGFYDNALVADEWDSEATWNREHVWPNSHGGGSKGDTTAPYLDADMHMTRPASVSINSSRGNSFYGNSLYDAGQYVADYRGIAARIIFYCAIADTQLKIVDQNDGNGHQMGKLSDLLSWNLQYGPDKSSTASLAKRIEANRNKEIYSRNGLQGNRNPFIDHPEYACKIWGNTNDTTRSICGLSGKTLSSLTYTGSLSKTTYEEGDSFDPTGLTVTATYSDNSQETVTNSVVWTPSPLTEGTTSVTGSYTYGNNTLSVTVNGLTVTEKTSGGGGDNAYTITFKPAQSEGSQEISYSNLLSNDYVSGNTLVSSFSAASKVYASTNGLKLGSGSATGSFTFGLVNAAQSSISGIDVNIKKYGSDTGTVDYTLGGKSGSFTPTTNGGIQSATFDPVVSATSLTIATSTKRAYISSITLHIGNSGSTSEPKVNSISIDSSLSLDVYNNKTYTFNPEINADPGADTTVTWESSDPTVASINTNGTITALKAGETTITATCGGKTATCSVTVSDSTPAGEITYQLEADVSEVPFNSGTNHVTSVGVKVYRYNDGVKGSVVSSGNVNVDTSSLGTKIVQYSYNNVQYSTTVKVSNHNAAPVKGLNLVGDFSSGSSSITTPWTGYGIGGDYATGNAPYLTKFDTTGDYIQVEGTTTAQTIHVSVNLKMIGGANTSSFTVSAFDSTDNPPIASVTLNIAGSQNDTMVVEDDINNSLGATVNFIRFTFTKGSNIGVKQMKVTAAGETDFESKQALAWATYFIAETRTAETCLAEQDSQKLAGLQAKWVDLAYEYTQMTGDSKDKFCTSSDATIVAARTHYLYIVSKFGAENLGTDGAFVKDSEDHVLRSKQYNPLSLLTENTPIAIIAVLSLVSVSAVGLYLYAKKRKEE